MRASTRSLWWISGANPGGRNGRWNEATLRRGDLCELENHEILENLRTVISVERFSRGSVNDTNDLVNLVGWCLDGWWWAAHFCEMSPWLCFNQSVNPHLNSYILSNMGGFITCDDSQRKKNFSSHEPWNCRRFSTASFLMVRPGTGKNFTHVYNVPQVKGRIISKWLWEQKGFDFRFRSTV